MDIDCDGTPNSLCQCDGNCDTQDETSFKGTPAMNSYGIEDLDASIHNYVVFGNADDAGHTPGYVTFDPTRYGVQPLSLMAVVCNNQLVRAIPSDACLIDIIDLRQYYGIWGDQNGSDGPPLVGEASISIGKLCFGNSITNNNGHDQADVLYLAFTGTDAVPGKNGANWKAKTSADFQNFPQFNTIGDRLVQRVQA
jgi:hypothetical protein